jgi:uncharacterized OB-fold protein
MSDQAKRDIAEPRGSTAYRGRKAPMDADFPGTALRSRDFKSGKVLTVDDEYRVAYAWDAGIAIGAYLDGLRDGKLLASVAPGSGRTMVPPRTFCELSWTPSQKLVELPGTGRINTFSLSYVNWDATRRESPLMPAVIELDGASEGMGILHMLGNVDPQEVEIGMPVRAVWRPEGEREGSITDILYFEPVPKPKKAAGKKKPGKKAKKSTKAATRRAKS